MAQVFRLRNIIRRRVLTNDQLLYYFTFCASRDIFLKEFPPSYKNIFAQFMTMWKKPILARVTRIQKGNWG